MKCCLCKGAPKEARIISNDNVYKNCMPFLMVSLPKIYVCKNIFGDFYKYITKTFVLNYITN